MEPEEREEGLEDAPEPESRPQAVRRFGEYSTLAFVFPACMVVGFFGGRWLGGILGSPAAGSLLGLGLGTAAAFLTLYRTLLRLESRETMHPGDPPAPPHDSA